MKKRKKEEKNKTKNVLILVFTSEAVFCLGGESVQKIPTWNNKTVH